MYIYIYREREILTREGAKEDDHRAQVLGFVGGVGPVEGLSGGQKMKIRKETS